MAPHLRLFDAGPEDNRHASAHAFARRWRLKLKSSSTAVRPAPKEKHLVVPNRVFCRRFEGSAVGSEMGYVNVEYKDALNYIFSAKSTRERMAAPVGPCGSQGRPSSIQQVAAMSRCIHGVSSATSLMTQAAVIAPPP